MSVAERPRVVVLRVGPVPPPREPTLRLPAATATLQVHGQEVRCAFCHDAFERDAPLYCPACRALLHDGCWREAGRCPSLGCRGPAATGARSGPRQSAVLAWALHALTLSPWLLLWLWLAAVQGGPAVAVVVMVVVACGFLVVPHLPRADASWVLALSGFVFSATLVFVFVQSQKAFLIVD